MSACVNASGNRPLEQLKVAELREELKKRGLGQKGVKKELVERLEEAMRKDGQLEPLNSDLDTTVNEKHSLDAHLGSVDSEEEAEGDEDEHKTEGEVESVIRDQVGSASQNQELEQAVGMEADVGGATRDIVPQVSGFKESSLQDEPKHELVNEANRNARIESNDRESGGPGLPTGLPSEVENPTEIEAPWASDAKDCLNHAPDANSLGNLETNAQAPTLSASVVESDFEAEPGMASLEPDETHQQTNNTELADDTKESRVGNVKVEEVQSEEAHKEQPTTNLNFGASQPLNESSKFQSDEEDGASKSYVSPLSEIKPERDYELDGNIKLQDGVVGREEEKNANLVQFFPQEGMEHGEDTALAGEEQERAKYSSGDEKPGHEYVKMLEGGGADGKGLELKTRVQLVDLSEDRRNGKGLELKTRAQLVDLSEDRRENGYKSMEIDSQVYSGQKRREEEGETGQQEPAKRQRRWNSGNKLTVEAAKPLTTGTVKEIIQSDGKDVVSSVTSPPKTTPKVVATSRPASLSVRVDPLANGGRGKQRLVPPASRSPTTSLRVDRFLRPFTLKAVKELFSQTGTFIDFWMDQIKTHCYVTYTSVEEAIATRNALYDLQWPLSFGNSLIADFVDPEEVKVRCEGQLEKPAITPTTTPRAGVLARPPLPVALLPLPPPPTLPGPPPPPPMRERPAPPPKKELEPPVPTLDDLFKKTKAKPHIYYLPLTDDEVAVKLAAKKRESQLRDPSVKA